MVWRLLVARSAALRGGATEPAADTKWSRYEFYFSFRGDLAFDCAILSVPGDNYRSGCEFELQCHYLSNSGSGSGASQHSVAGKCTPGHHFAGPQKGYAPAGNRLIPGRPNRTAQGSLVSKISRHSSQLEIGGGSFPGAPFVFCPRPPPTHFSRTL